MGPPSAIATTNIHALKTFFEQKNYARVPQSSARAHAPQTTAAGSGVRALDKLGVSESLILITDKFASSERHNKWKIMSAPTQVGVSGDGGR